jgi:hypothetical protein
MPLRISARSVARSDHWRLNLIRSRFIKAARQKAARDRARAVVADLIGVSTPRGVGGGGSVVDGASPSPAGRAKV